MQIRRTLIQTAVGLGVASAALLGSVSGADAQTREHILLARQVGVAVAQHTDATAADFASVEDDTTTAKNSSAVVSLGKLGRVEAR